MAKQIKKSFFWIQKVLEVLGQRTSLPSEVGEIIEPHVDVFGWERLAERSSFSASAVAAPAFLVNGPITPPDVVRFIINASVRHTDTGVSHLIWIDKDMRGPSAQLVGVTTPYLALPDLVDASAESWLTLAPTHRLRGRSQDALVAGALTLVFEFIDLPIGEYVP